MNAMEFCRDYAELVEQFDAIIIPEMYPAIRRLYRYDPHDIVTPEVYFSSKAEALGFVFQLLLREAKKDGVKLGRTGLKQFA